MLLIDLESLSRDDRGDTIVQFVMVLPIFIILVFGSYEIWKLVHLKQTLEGATIQATRYLSIEGPYLMKEPPGYPISWQQRAQDIVYKELAKEPLLRDEFDLSRLWVAVDAPFGRPECPGRDSSRPSQAERRAERAQFVVHSQLPIPSPIRIPFVPTKENLVLSESHWHYLECGPNTPPTPVP